MLVGTPTSQNAIKLNIVVFQFFHVPKSFNKPFVFIAVPGQHTNLCVWCPDPPPELCIFASRCSELMKFYDVGIPPKYSTYNTKRVFPNTEAILFGTGNATTAMGFLNWRCHEVIDLCVFERSCIATCSECLCCQRIAISISVRKCSLVKVRRLKYSVQKKGLIYVQR